MTTTNTTHSDIPFGPDPNPHKPKLRVSGRQLGFPLFTSSGRRIAFPYAESRRYSPPTAAIEHWLAISSAIGIERGFVVTPSVHDLDPAVTLDAIARADGRIRGMVRANASMTSTK